MPGVKTLLCVSVSRGKAADLQRAGPRRDFAALASAVNGELLYAIDAGQGSALSRIVGPHIRQAFRAAWRVRRGDVCFADGEHIGIPLAVLLGLTGRRSVRLVMLGHYVDRPWKLRLFRVASLVFPGAVLVLHSVTQRERIVPAVGERWEVRVVPYQVDTDFWQSMDREPSGGTPVVLAVGSENRDYETLVAAAEGLEAKIRIAAGSHWARRIAGAGHLPGNVEYISKPLPFEALREEYAAASVVVVPLRDVTNQSGVTVILEAMSMGRPIVVTATAGQRECIRGGLVSGAADVEDRFTADRGPQLFGDEVEPGETGVYVACEDPTSLQAGLTAVLKSTEVQRRLGSNARAAAERHFRFERFVQSLASLLHPTGAVGEGVD